MSVAVETVALLKLNLMAGVPVAVAIPVASADEVEILYSIDGVAAVYVTDYTVAIDAGDQPLRTFSFTPTASLITKINAAIAANPLNVNVVAVRRKGAATSDATPAYTMNTTYVSLMFDRAFARIAELRERVNRSVRLSPMKPGETPLQIAAGIGGNKLLVTSADGLSIVAGRSIPGDGVDGNDGWTPVFAIVEDGARRVQQVVDWTGGEGVKPATGMYVGPVGYTALIDNAVDVRGPAGSGDMTGPAGAVLNRLLAFADNTGKFAKDSGILIADVVTRLGATMLGTLTLAADPVGALDAATKQYVDNAVALGGRRGAVRTASTANINLAAPGANIDAVAMAVGQWFLAKDQTVPAQNGVYRWNGAAVAATRVNEFDTYDEHPGSMIAVQEGTVNGDLLFICTSNVGGTLGVTAIVFNSVGVSISDLSITFAKMAAAAIAGGSDYSGNVASKLLTPAAVWAAATEVAISEADLVAGINLSLGFNFAVTLTAARNAGSFQNAKPGQCGRIRLLQDATGGRVVTKHANMRVLGGGALQHAQGANAVGLLYYDCRTNAEFYMSGSAQAWG